MYSLSTEVLSLDVNNAPDLDTSEFTAEQYLDRRRGKKSSPAKRRFRVRYFIN